MRRKIHIEIDDQDSWSDHLKTILSGNIEILTKFSKKEIEISRLPSTERWNSLNEFESERNDVIALIDNAIYDCNLIGYHCTRLTENEAEDIRATGLQLLSQDFIIKRINKLVDEEIIQKKNAIHLISKNQCDHQYRRN